MLKNLLILILAIIALSKVKSKKSVGSKIDRLELDILTGKALLIIVNTIDERTILLNKISQMTSRVFVELSPNGCLNPVILVTAQYYYKIYNFYNHVDFDAVYYHAHIGQAVTDRISCKTKFPFHLITATEDITIKTLK